MVKPDYAEFSFSVCMGPELRKEVERQLLVDTAKYDISTDNIKFDWSESCVEGHRVAYLDGEVENFSGIKLFDCNDNFLGEGWMEFIFEEDEQLFIVFWEFLYMYVNGEKISIKSRPGVPNYIWNKLPN